MPITTRGKLNARRVHADPTKWPEQIPEDQRQDCYDSYTYHYHFEPAIVPPNDEEE